MLLLIVACSASPGNARHGFTGANQPPSSTAAMVARADETPNAARCVWKRVILLDLQGGVWISALTAASILAGRELFCLIGQRLRQLFFFDQVNAGQ